MGSNNCEIYLITEREKHPWSSQSSPSITMDVTSLSYQQLQNGRQGAGARRRSPEASSNSVNSARQASHHGATAQNEKGRGVPKLPSSRGQSVGGPQTDFSSEKDQRSPAIYSSRSPLAANAFSAKTPRQNNRKHRSRAEVDAVVTEGVFKLPAAANATAGESFSSHQFSGGAHRPNRRNIGHLLSTNGQLKPTDGEASSGPDGSHRDGPELPDSIRVQPLVSKMSGKGHTRESYANYRDSAVESERSKPMPAPHNRKSFSMRETESNGRLPVNQDTLPLGKQLSQRSKQHSSCQQSGTQKAPIENGKGGPDHALSTINYSPLQYQGDANGGGTSAENEKQKGSRPVSSKHRKRRENSIKLPKMQEKGKHSSQLDGEYRDPQSQPQRKRRKSRMTVGDEEQEPRRRETATKILSRHERTERRRRNRENQSNPATPDLNDGDQKVQQRKVRSSKRRDRQKDGEVKEGEDQERPRYRRKRNQKASSMAAGEPELDDPAFTLKDVGSSQKREGTPVR